jgi:type I restriction enzyme S subunit
MVLLKNICVRITKGTTPTTLGMPFTDFGVNFIKAEALNGDPTLNSGGFSCISESTHHALRRSILTEADVLVTIAGANIGKCGLVKKEHLPANTNQAVGIIRVNNELADPKYVYYHFKQEKMFSFIQSLNAQAAQPNINLASLGGIKIPLPPLSTQKKIAGILSAYDDAIENNLRRIKLLSEMAQITYEEWFVRLRFPGYATTPINEATGLPEGWKKRKMSDFCSKITDGTHESPRQSEDGYKLITGKHIIDGFIEFETAYLIAEEDHLAIKKRSGLGKGDILFSNIGTLGSTAMVTQEFEFSCKNVIIFKYKKNQTNFLYTYLSNKNTQNKLFGQSAGVAQKFFSLNFIRAFQEYYPPNHLVEKFDEHVSQIYELRQWLHDQNQRLREARDILLPRLMTGVIDAEKYQPEKLLKEIA